MSRPEPRPCFAPVRGQVRHEGTARRNPKDTDVPEIGEELAAARALSGLAHDLLEAAVADVEQNVHQAVRIKPVT